MMRVRWRAPDGLVSEIYADEVTVYGAAVAEHHEDRLAPPTPDKLVVVEALDAFISRSNIKTDACKIDDHHGYVIPHGTKVARGPGTEYLTTPSGSQPGGDPHECGCRDAPQSKRRGRTAPARAKDLVARLWRATSR